MQSSGCSLLAGDIGATKTTLALYDAAFWPGPPLLAPRTFRNALYPSFDDLLHEFLAPGSLPPTVACFGVAGPVIGNAVRMTNLNWSLDGAQLQAEHGFAQVFLVNDLVATAMGVVHLPATDLYPLNPGIPQPGGVMAVLAPGSGLGEAFLVPHEGAYLPFPSEGGHASFAPRTAEQVELLAFMQQHHSHVSVEQVCSGLALPGLFAFLTTRETAPTWLLDELEQATDRTPVIIRAALEAVAGGKSCDIAVQTLTLFADILADEAANLALKTLALGGLYLGGGLAPRLLPFLTPGRFLSIFARGTYQHLLSQIPIHIICNPQAALFGAAAIGKDLVMRVKG
jgi:glucokinase